MNAATPKLESYTIKVSETLADKVQDVLDKIPEFRRRLLALRGYLRHRQKITTNWAWSNVQAKDFLKHAGKDILVPQVKLVTKNFEDANPGYTLKTAALVRTLQRQIQLWNTSGTKNSSSVATCGDKLVQLAEQELRKATYPESPTPDATAAFAKFLKSSQPGTIYVATPGLSDHGHGNAVDFVVEEKATGKVVASASSKSTAWGSPQNFGAKLKKATEGTKFKGPLASPPEAWHFTIDVPTNSLGLPK